MFDILAFGPHADDVELGMGGTLALHAGQGRRVAICDLTRGELGTGGDPAIRLQEAEAAGRVLGVALRFNLGLPDLGLIYGSGGRGAGGEQVRRVADTIRRLQPAVVAIPWAPDRHPDHVAAHHLLQDAIFSAALLRYETDHAPHRPRRVVYYFINDAAEPSFLVDISAAHEQKAAALACYRSQFAPDPAGAETPLNRPYGLPYKVDARDRYLGSLAGVARAEGFMLKEPVLLPGVL